MSQLSHLECLCLGSIPNLEYVEEGSNNNNNSNTPSRDAPSTCASRGDTEFTFFPSLVMLRLCDMHKLKGWWRSDRASIDVEARHGGWRWMVALRAKQQQQ